MRGQIKVNNIGKAYKQYLTRWSRLLEWMVPLSKTRHSLKWILQDINFTVEAGEAVGIVGVNGAGKSTLLKIITGTTQQSTGEVSISGRVSALLELGMGFHPDFTGRQNVTMAAQLMGMTPEEIASAMPRVKEFAEIGDYIEQPIRIYSSGMQVRLAFSIATVLRPDVLIVDEALSVGDTYFQHKSFDRIREFRKQGTTLLLVSHDKTTIQSLCDKAILLEDGRIAKAGIPEEVMDFYNALLAEKENSTTIKQEVLGNGRVKTFSGTGEARIEEVELLNHNGERIDCVCVGEEVKLVVHVKVYTKLETLVLGYGIKDRLGQVIFGTNTWYTDQVIKRTHAGDEFKFEIKFPANLGVGSYSVTIALHNQSTHITANYFWQDLALVFNVVNAGEIEFSGCNWIKPEITFKAL